MTATRAPAAGRFGSISVLPAADVKTLLAYLQSMTQIITTSGHMSRTEKVRLHIHIKQVREKLTSLLQPSLLA